MTTCRTCDLFRAPFEPRGPSLERFDAGCFPAHRGEVPPAWPRHPDEDRDCAVYWPQGVRIVDASVPTSAELTRRVLDPRWRG